MCDVSSHCKVAKVYTEIASLYNIRKKFEDCEKLLTKAKEIYTEEKGEDAPENAGVLTLFGRVRLGQNKPQDALVYLEKVCTCFFHASWVYYQALIVAETRLGSEHLVTADVLYQLVRPI